MIGWLLRKLFLPKTPDQIISIDGDEYMRRWHLVYVPRELRISIHRFMRGDADRELHNHPWKWSFSFILNGFYEEERLVDQWGEVNPLVSVDPKAVYGRRKNRRVWFFNLFDDRTFHRVSKLFTNKHGEVWTLFVAGPVIQHWGFLSEDGTWTYWREFERIKYEQEAKA